MMALLRVELGKLRGSLALLVAVGAPALPGALAFLALVSNDQPGSWQDSFRFALPIWSLFLAPMIVAAFTALVAQIEHRERGWDYVLALPIPRWMLFATKAIVVFAGLVLMTVLAIAFAALGTIAGGAIGSGLPKDPFPWAWIGEQAVLIVSAMATLVAVQLWIALRFASFIVPLLVGIGGTVVAIAVMITQTRQADWFPWVLPFRALVSEDPQRYAIAGLVGGCVISAAMVIDLSRREFR